MHGMSRWAIAGTVIAVASAGEAQTPTFTLDALATASQELSLTVPLMTAVGDSEDERARWREMARVQVAFYGSTANYGFIFDQIGFEGTTARIRERQKAGDLAGMSAVITDEILEHFVVIGSWDELSDAIVARLGGIAGRAVACFAGTAWQHDRSSLARWGEVARDVIARTS